MSSTRNQNLKGQSSLTRKASQTARFSQITVNPTKVKQTARFIPITVNPTTGKPEWGGQPTRGQYVTPAGAPWHPPVAAQRLNVTATGKGSLYDVGDILIGKDLTSILFPGGRKASDANLGLAALELATMFPILRGPRALFQIGKALKVGTKLKPAVGAAKLVWRKPTVRPLVFYPAPKVVRGAAQAARSIAAGTGAREAIRVVGDRWQEPVIRPLLNTALKPVGIASRFVAAPAVRVLRSGSLVVEKPAARSHTGQLIEKFLESTRPVWGHLLLKNNEEMVGNEVKMMLETQEQIDTIAADALHKASKGLKTDQLYAVAVAANPGASAAERIALRTGLLAQAKRRIDQLVQSRHIILLESARKYLDEVDGRTFLKPDAPKALHDTLDALINLSKTREGALLDLNLDEFTEDIMRGRLFGEARVAKGARFKANEDVVKKAMKDNPHRKAVHELIDEVLGGNIEDANIAKAMWDHFVRSWANTHHVKGDEFSYLYALDEGYRKILGTSLEHPKGPGALAQIFNPWQTFDPSVLQRNIRRAERVASGKVASPPKNQSMLGRVAGKKKGKIIVVAGPVTVPQWIERVLEAIPDLETRKVFATWYKDAAPLFKRIFGENWESYFRAWASSQANASPTHGMQAVFRIADKIRNKQPIGKLEFSVVSESIQKAFNGEPVDKYVAAKLSDFINALLLSKNRTWMDDTPVGGSPAPADIHASRDAGYVDAALGGFLIRKHGFKDGDFVLDRKSGTPSSIEYEEIRLFYTKISEHLNEVAFDGITDWDPAAAQALGWGAIQMTHGVKPETLAYVFEQHTRRIAVELAPGEGSPLHLAFFARYKDLQAGARDRVTEAVLGSLVQPLANLLSASVATKWFYAKGTYKGVENHNIFIDLTGSSGSSLTLAQAFAFLTQQSEVWSVKRLPGKQLSIRDALLGKNIPSVRGIDVKLVKGSSEDDYQRFYRELLKENDIVGMQQLPDEHGIRIIDSPSAIADRKELKTTTDAAIALTKKEGLKQAERAVAIAKQKTDLALALARHDNREELRVESIRRAAKRAKVKVDIEKDLRFEVRRSLNDWTDKKAGELILAQIATRESPAFVRELRSLGATVRQKFDDALIAEEQLVRVAAAGTPGTPGAVAPTPAGVVPEGAAPTAGGIPDAPDGMLAQRGLAESGLSQLQGAVSFPNPGSAILHLIKGKADVSTPAHEFIHVARRFFLSDDDNIKVAKRLGSKNGLWTKEIEEKFAKQFESWLRLGGQQSTNTAMSKFFKTYSERMRELYTEIDDLPGFDPELRELFDLSTTVISRKGGRLVGFEDLTHSGHYVPNEFGLPVSFRRGPLAAMNFALHGGTRLFRKTPSGHLNEGPPLGPDLTKQYTGNLYRSGMFKIDWRHASTRSLKSAMRLKLAREARVKLLAASSDTKQKFDDIPIVENLEKALSPEDLKIIRLVHTTEEISQGELDEVSEFHIDPLRLSGLGKIAELVLGSELALKGAVEAGVKIENIRWLPKDFLISAGLLDVPLAQKAFFEAQDKASRLLRASAWLAVDAVNDITRAVVLYLNPMYIPVNLLGNLALNILQQGVFMPANVAKASLMHHHLSTSQRLLIDKFMGRGVATSMYPVGSRKITGPLANMAGVLIDLIPRRAAFLHEARRAGYSGMKELAELLDNAVAGDKEAIRILHYIKTKANDAIIDYNRMTQFEKDVISRWIFFYPWIRGSTRYSIMYPKEHPAVAAALAYAETRRRELREKKLGDTPYWAELATPIGKMERFGKTYPRTVNIRQLVPFSTPIELFEGAKGFATGDVSAPQLVGHLSPFLSTTGQVLFGKDPFSGRTVEQSPRGWAEAAFKNLPPVRIAKSLLMQDDKRERKAENLMYPRNWTDELWRTFLSGLAPTPYNVKVAEEMAKEGTTKPVNEYRTKRDDLRLLDPNWFTPTEWDILDEQLERKETYDDLIKKEKKDLSTNRLSDRERAKVKIDLLVSLNLVSTTGWTEAELRNLTESLDTAAGLEALNRDLNKVLWGDLKAITKALKSINPNYGTTEEE